MLKEVILPKENGEIFAPSCWLQGKKRVFVETALQMLTDICDQQPHLSTAQRLHSSPIGPSGCRVQRLARALSSVAS